VSASSLLGILTVLAVSGCGYSVGFKPREFVAPNGERRPIRTIAVPIFENRSPRRELEFPLTEAVLREIQRRTPLIVTSPDKADVTLLGTIESFDQIVLVRGPNDTVLEQSANIVLGVRATDRAGQELFRYAGARAASATSGPALIEASRFAQPGGTTSLTPPASLVVPTAEAFENLAERVVMLLEARFSTPPNAAKPR
jgi:hypothetical protein